MPLMPWDFICPTWARCPFWLVLFNYYSKQQARTRLSHRSHRSFGIVCFMLQHSTMCSSNLTDLRYTLYLSDMPSDFSKQDKAHWIADKSHRLKKTTLQKWKLALDGGNESLSKMFRAQNSCSTVMQCDAFCSWNVDLKVLKSEKGTRFWEICWLFACYVCPFAPLRTAES